MAVLVTGGAGFIGSHACLCLLEAGCEVVVVDNLSNSKKQSIRRVSECTGKPIGFYEADLRDTSGMTAVFRENKIDTVLHFAGFKAVGESVEFPMKYYENNISGTLALCEVMAAHGVHDLVFSSSATVYGDPPKVPIIEDFPLAPTNPYGRSKRFIEQILEDIHLSDNSWNIALLRYFNPVGAHPSGCIGEDPNGIPNNLMPFICQVAAGKREKLFVFGDDYPTPDGTGIRDYIHVMDLAKGHLQAIEKLGEHPGVVTFNLGTGKGYSVLDVVRAFEKASGKELPYQVVKRRPGDIAVCYTDPTKAGRELGWRAELGIDDMCRDAWRWQAANPNGYDNGD
ncbi:MAG: UDP-glucose 4-epimerase GalE [Desulfobacterales bacterium]